MFFSIFCQATNFKVFNCSSLACSSAPKLTRLFLSLLLSLGGFGQDQLGVYRLENWRHLCIVSLRIPGENSNKNQ